MLISYFLLFSYCFIPLLVAQKWWEVIELNHIHQAKPLLILFQSRRYKLTFPELLYSADYKFI